MDQHGGRFGVPHILIGEEMKAGKAAGVGGFRACGDVGFDKVADFGHPLEEI